MTIFFNFSNFSVKDNRLTRGYMGNDTENAYECRLSLAILDPNCRKTD